MNLTVDCTLTTAELALPSTSALAQLLTKAKVKKFEQPLEAMVCGQFGLQASPDCPIAAIAASADGFAVGGDYFLRADPVNLVLQRDCFTLGNPVPLYVAREHAESIVTTLNAHFNQDGLHFVIGQSGAWYLRLAQTPQISTTLPSVAMGKNIHTFMPQGLESSKWLAVINEVQMLLFEQPVNHAREAKGESAVNSVWFSGGGVMPQVTATQNDESVIVANNPFYQGLAKLACISYQAFPSSLDTVLESKETNVRLALAKPHQEIWFSALLFALKTKKLKKLTLHIGFYEKSLIVEMQPLDMFKFWRTSKPVMDYFQ